MSNEKPEKVFTIKDVIELGLKAVGVIVVVKYLWLWLKVKYARMKAKNKHKIYKYKNRVIKVDENVITLDDANNN